MFTRHEASEKIDSFRGAVSLDREREREGGRKGSCRIWGIKGQYFQEDRGGEVVMGRRTDPEVC